MNENIYTQLHDILSTEYQLYKQLNQIALDKKDVIIENNIVELGVLVKNDESIISELRAMEKERNTIIINICNKHNKDVEDISFQKLIKDIPAPWQDKLSNIRILLLEIIDELHDQNEQNKMLVTEAIKLNNISINMFLEALEPHNAIYDVKQKSVKSKTNHFIDRRG